MLEYEIGLHYYLELTILDSSGNFVNGLDITYKIYNSKTEEEMYSGSMVDTEYVYKSEDYIKFSDIGQYRVVYFTPDGYENGSEVILARKLKRSNYIVQSGDGDGVWSSSDKLNLMNKVGDTFDATIDVDNKLSDVLKLLNQLNSSNQDISMKIDNEHEKVNHILQMIRQNVEHIRDLLNKDVSKDKILNELDGLYELYVKLLDDDKIEEMVKSET